MPGQTIDDLNKREKAITFLRPALDTVKAQGSVAQFCRDNSLHDGSVSRWFSGGRTPGWDNLNALASAFIKAKLIKQEDWENACA